MQIRPLLETNWKQKTKRVFYTKNIKKIGITIDKGGLNLLTWQSEKVLGIIPSRSLIRAAPLRA